MQGNLKVMLENVLIFKETGQITNPKLQISNKLQILNIKSQTERVGSFLLFDDWILFFGAYLLFGDCDLEFPDKACLEQARPG